MLGKEVFQLMNAILLNLLLLLVLRNNGHTVHESEHNRSIVAELFPLEAASVAKATKDLPLG